MTTAPELQPIEALEAQLSAGKTLPYEWYTDPGVLKTERQRVFGRNWLYVGHVEQVAEPGDFFTLEAAGVPLIITRDSAGGVNALVNVCRHRGAEVVLEQQGNCGRALQCHYHAWTYGLDGKLLSAPRSRQEPEFDKADFPLRAVRTELYGPFIFVNLDADGPALTEYLGELPAIVASTGIDLGRLRHRERRSYTVKANWKVVVENFLECYHCAVAHPTFAGVIDLDTYKIEEHEYFSTQHGAATDAADAPEGTVTEGRYNYLWPSFMLNVYPGPGNVSTNAIIPIDEGTTLAVYDFFYEESVTQEQEREIRDLIDLVMVEDVVLCESVQRGMASGIFERGKLMTKHEHAIAHFQGLVSRTLAP